jgi:hypothetical protein
MTITYELYPSDDGMYPGVIPREYVSALGGETYKYSSSNGGKKMTRKRRKTKKSKKTRARKITPLK